MATSCDGGNECADGDIQEENSVEETSVIDGKVILFTSTCILRVVLEEKLFSIIIW